MSYVSEVAADSPLAFYRLGDASGNAADSSGNGRSASSNGGTKTYGASGLLLGASNGCVDFGATGYFEVASAAWMNVSNITVEAIIRPTAVGGGTQRTFLSRRGSSAAVADTTFGFRVDSAGKISFYVSAGGTTSGLAGATVLTANTAYHVAAVYDGSAVSVYVNGVLDGSAPRTGALNAPAFPIRIGRAQFSDGGFAGKVDEVALYGTALSGTRIAAHFAAMSTAELAAALTSTGSVTAALTARLGLAAEITEAGVLAADLSVVAAVDDTSLAASIASVSRLESDLTLVGVEQGVTDTADYANGRTRTGSGEDHTLYPVTPLPAHLVVTPHRVIAQQMPQPELVEGRPT